ncbi:heavy-metal-associated domain-containing protein [Sulfuricurvum sp.]|uniref:heavy-metal-associated domain-containing protein n=1 Tax=Sulfuricurvum sp. TaxID=2025608 RepID=UPI003BB53ACC
MKKAFEVANVRCGGCANTITTSLQKSGFEKVSVDLSCEPRKVTVEIADEAQLAQVQAILRSLGYPLTTDERGFSEDTILKAKSFVSCALGKIN